MKKRFLVIFGILFLISIISVSAQLKSDPSECDGSETGTISGSNLCADGEWIECNEENGGLVRVYYFCDSSEGVWRDLELGFKQKDYFDDYAGTKCEQNYVGDVSMVYSATSNGLTVKKIADGAWQSNWQNNVWIWEDKVVYIKNIRGQLGIYGCDLKNCGSTEVRIVDAPNKATSDFGVSFHNNILVWSQGDYSKSNYQKIYGCDTSNGWQACKNNKILLASGKSDFIYPEFYNNILVFEKRKKTTVYPKYGPDACRGGGYTPSMNACSDVYYCVLEDGLKKDYCDDPADEGEYNCDDHWSTSGCRENAGNGHAVKITDYSMERHENGWLEATFGQAHVYGNKIVYVFYYKDPHQTNYVNGARDHPTYSQIKLYNIETEEYEDLPTWSRSWPTGIYNDIVITNRGIICNINTKECSSSIIDNWESDAHPQIYGNRIAWLDTKKYTGSTPQISKNVIYYCLIDPENPKEGCVRGKYWIEDPWPGAGRNLIDIQGNYIYDSPHIWGNHMAWVKMPKKDANNAELYSFSFKKTNSIDPECDEVNVGDKGGCISGAVCEQDCKCSFYVSAGCRDYITAEECVDSNCKWCPECKDNWFNEIYTDGGSCIESGENCEGIWKCVKDKCGAECDVNNRCPESQICYNDGCSCGGPSGDEPDEPDEPECIVYIDDENCVVRECTNGTSSRTCDRRYKGGNITIGKAIEDSFCTMSLNEEGCYDVFCSGEKVNIICVHEECNPKLNPLNGCVTTHCNGINETRCPDEEWDITNPGDNPGETEPNCIDYVDDEGCRHFGCDENVRTACPRKDSYEEIIFAGKAAEEDLNTQEQENNLANEANELGTVVYAISEDRRTEVNKVVILKKAEENVAIETEDVDVETDRAVEIKSSNLYIKSQYGDRRINYMPSTALNLAKEKTEGIVDEVGDHIKLLEEKKMVYEVGGKTRGRFLGIIPTNVGVRIRVNADDGFIKIEKSPFFSI